MSDFDFGPPRRPRSRFPTLGLLAFITVAATAVAAVAVFLLAEQSAPNQAHVSNHTAAEKAVVRPVKTSSSAPTAGEMWDRSRPESPAAFNDAATDRRLSAQLLEQATRREELDSLIAAEQRISANARRLGSLNPVDRACGLDAVRFIKQYGIEATPADVIAAAETVAPDYVESRRFLRRLKLEGLGELTADERTLIGRFPEDAPLLRRAAKESAVKDPLWREFEGLVGAADATPFGVLTAAQRQAAVAIARRAREIGSGVLSVEEVRKLIRAGAGDYLMREAGK